MIPEIIAQIKNAKPTMPSWEDLSKEYDVLKHKVVTDKNMLKDIPKNGGIEYSARVTYGFQKLATRRMTQMAFAIPVKRIYDTGDDKTKIAQAEAVEEVYRRARIDSVNIRRMRAYFAACEIATMWFPVKSKNKHYGFNSEYKLRCITYSPMEERFSNLSEAEIYPVFDRYDDLVKLAIELKVKEDNEEVVYFYIYEAEKITIYKQIKGIWQEEVETDEMPTGKIPGVYLSRPMPVWEHLTNNNDEIELSLSRESNILRKNSAPILGVTGELVGNKPAGEVAREVYQFKDGGKIEYITWAQQIDAFKFYIETLKKNMDEELQLPNLSMDNVKDLGQIGEGARKTVLTDAHLKVGDESGAIIEFLERECNVIKAYLGQMNKSWESSINDLKVEHVITPFIQNDEMAEIDKISKLTQKPILSVQTAMKRFGVENPAEEYKRLLDEQENDNKTNVFETGF